MECKKTVNYDGHLSTNFIVILLSMDKGQCGGVNGMGHLDFFKSTGFSSYFKTSETGESQEPNIFLFMSTPLFCAWCHHRMDIYHNSQKVFEGYEKSNSNSKLNHSSDYHYSLIQSSVIYSFNLLSIALQFSAELFIWHCCA